MLTGLEKTPRTWYSHQQLQMALICSQSLRISSTPEISKPKRPNILDMRWLVPILLKPSIKMLKYLQMDIQGHS